MTFSLSYNNDLNTPDSFSNDLTRLSQLTVQGTSHFFNVSFTPDVGEKDPTHDWIGV